jgi:hypothetical protein
MKTVFPDMKAVYDFHAKWLWKDKISVYFPSVRVGVEFSPTGNGAELGRKWVACKEHGIALYVLVASDIEQAHFGPLQRMINSRIKSKPKVSSAKKGRQCRSSKT